MPTTTTSRLALLLMLIGLLPATLHADLDILIVGSTHSFSEGGESGVIQEQAFDPSTIATHLQSILANDPAVSETVNVVFDDVYKTETREVQTSSTGYTIWDFRCYSLAQHYMWPTGKTNRLDNLRGAAGTQWDYVILMGDPYVIANFPGMYTEGAKLIIEEVQAGTAEPILFAQWPENSSTFSVSNFNEVVYRTGDSADVQVVPAGKAWDSLSPQDSSANHPTPDGAYLAAASIYSKIYNKSAKTSSYSYDDAIADHSLSEIQANEGASQYSGSFTNITPFTMKYVKKRLVSFRETGTSTEDRIRNGLTAVDALYGITVTTTATHDPTDWDFNYGRGNDWWEDSKDYEVNTNLHDRSYGFPMHYYGVTNAVHHMDFGIDKKFYSGSYNDGTDLGIAYNMIRPGTREESLPVDVRCAPIRLMWSKMREQAPNLNPLGDNTHMATHLNHATASFFLTLLNGRCPVTDEPTPGTSAWNNWLGQKIGYETAWQMSHLTTRAPGFQVLPTSPTATNVTPSASQTLSVRFMNAPTSVVTVAVSADDPLLGNVSPSLLTFTPANYTNAQTVTVLGESGAAGTFEFNVILTTSSTDPIFDSLSDCWDFSNTRPNGVPPSDILIYGNSQVVIPGEMTPTPSNHTDFGITSTFVTRQFMITNRSTTTSLSLTNSPRVTLTDGSGHFALDADAAASINAGSTTTFDITYTPTVSGIHTALVTIGSTDVLIPSYSFAIKGTRASAPTVNATGSESSSPTTAWLSGQLTGGAMADAWICWGDNDGGTTSIGSWDNAASLGSFTEGASFSNQASGLLFGIEYEYRVYVSNGLGDAWSSLVSFTTEAPQFSSGIPGLISGTVAGNIDTTTPNPGNGDGNAITNMGPWRAQAGGWAGNTTYIYTGQMYFDGTDYFFVESVDDQVWLEIDGVVVINDGSWNNTSSSGLISKPEGWYDFELRMSNGGGGSGPVNLNPGFQYHNGGGTSTADVDNWYPEDPGDATLFRTAYAPPENGNAVTNSTANNVAATTADLGGELNATQSVFSITAYWSTNNNAGASAWLADASAGSSSAGAYTNVMHQSLTAPAGSLQPDTTYYYTFLAANAATNIWASPNATFTTLSASLVTTNYSVPYSWLDAINPSWSNNYEAAVLDDPDGDGFTTWQEYWSGTDPEAASSHLRIDSISLSGTNTMLQWRHALVAPGLSDIIIQSSTNLTQGAWIYAGQKAPLNGTNAWMTAPAQGIFYRLVSTNAP